jgi:type II secretory pathway component PulM
MSLPTLRSLPNLTLPAALQQRWDALTLTGKRAVLCASELLMLALVWAFVYLPLQQSRERSTRAIAALRADYTSMQRHAASLQALRTTAPVAASGSNALADVSSLQALFGPRALVSIAQGTDAARSLRFKVVVNAMPYADWYDRTGAATARYKLNVLRMDLTRDRANVSGEFVLSEGN